MGSSDMGKCCLPPPQSSATHTHCLPHLGFHPHSLARIAPHAVHLQSTMKEVTPISVLKPKLSLGHSDFCLLTNLGRSQGRPLGGGVQH